MGGFSNWDWALDGWIVLAGMLSAVAAALLGNFLVLRRMSLLGDAISHAVLPGLAAAFFLSGSRSSVPMFLGAVIVGVLTALFTEWIRGSGKVDEGASMGVVFTSLFALGLVMIVQAADRVDLDPGCVLYGAIELTPLDTWSIGGREVPRVVVILTLVLVLNLGFVVLFFKELTLSSFDPALSTTLGFPAWLLHYLLMTLVAVTAVASFESVGNILVVAMFVVPPATAYLMTDRLSWMIGLSVVVAMLSAVAGHWLALTVPTWFGYDSTSTSGMMAFAAGLFFFIAALFAPRHGVLFRWWRHQRLGWQILSEDLLALLFKLEERDEGSTPLPDELAEMLLTSPTATRAILRWHRWRGDVIRDGGRIRLSESGRRQAQTLVRTHRLWEQYLVTEAGFSTERIHSQAERLEHFTTAALQDRLDQATDVPEVDPHGRPIPREPRDDSNTP